MKAFGYVIMIVSLIFVTTAQAQELKKLSLDTAAAISPKIESDGTIKAEGAGSIRIITQWPTTVCLDEVAGPDIENAKLIYSAKVKTDLDGNAFLEMWAHIGGAQYFSKGMNDAVSGKAGWKKISTPFIFQKGQRPDKVTLNIVINGRGTVWIDDVVLSREPL